MTKAKLKTKTADKATQNQEVDEGKMAPTSDTSETQPEKNVPPKVATTRKIEPSDLVNAIVELREDIAKIRLLAGQQQRLPKIKGGYSLTLEELSTGVVNLAKETQES